MLSWRIVTFHLLSSLRDPHPIIVRRGCYAIDDASVSDSVPVVLSDDPSLQEILWNFCRLRDKRERLTLKDNPNFYAQLPTLLEAHEHSIKIDPIVDFRHADEFYVLSDKQEQVHYVHIMICGQILHSFSNLWRFKNGIILKGSGVLQKNSPVSDFLTDICGRLMGESIVEASLRCTHFEFHITWLPVSFGRKFGAPLARASRNHRKLYPIATDSEIKLYRWTGWESLIGCLPPARAAMVDSAVDFSLCVFTKRRKRPGPNSPVRSNVIIYYASTDIDKLVPGPLATNV